MKITQNYIAERIRTLKREPEVKIYRKHWLLVLINENQIDWSCKLPLTPTGHIDNNKTGSSYIPCGIKPVPVILIAR